VLLIWVLIRVFIYGFANSFVDFTVPLLLYGLTFVIAFFLWLKVRLVRCASSGDCKWRHKPRDVEEKSLPSDIIAPMVTINAEQPTPAKADKNSGLERNVGEIDLVPKPRKYGLIAFFIVIMGMLPVVAVFAYYLFDANTGGPAEIFIIAVPYGIGALIGIVTCAGIHRRFV